MNSVAIFMFICFYVSSISATTEFQSWGNVNATELGRTRILLHQPVNNMYNFTFTYPDFPNEYPIIGIDLVDTFAPVTVKFIDGNIGDKQITIQLIKDPADRNSSWPRVDCYFYFYYNPPTEDVKTLGNVAIPMECPSPCSGDEICMKCCRENGFRRGSCANGIACGCTL